MLSDLGLLEGFHMLRPLLAGATLALLVAAPAFACTDISTKTVKLTGCVDDQWQAQAGEVQGAVEYAFLTEDQNFGLQVITETAVLPPDKLIDGILGNAVSAAGGNKDNVKLVSQRTETVDGKAVGEVEYSLTDGKFTITYQNLYYSAPGFGTVQILVYSTPEMATQAAFKQGQFVATVKLGS